MESGDMENIRFTLSGYGNEDGEISIALKAGDSLKILIEYKDPELAQNVIYNLPFIINDLLDDAMGEYVEYNIDEELKKILEEGK
jgi:hypothetical protein